MEPVTTIQKLPSGGDKKIKTLTEFKSLCEAEFKVRHNALVDEYRERNRALAQTRDRKVDEYNFIMQIINLNTLTQTGGINAGALMQVEQQIAALDYENLAASYSLQFWREQYGEQMIVQVLCDVMNYFLQQFQVKEMLNDVQIIQLASKLLSSQPKLRIRELVFVLNNAVQGKYGPTYQRIGIDTILQWLNRFYEDSAAHLENLRLNTKPEQARGAEPWHEIEKRLQRYETEQREKKRITEKVYGFEKRKNEIEEYKNNMTI